MNELPTLNLRVVSEPVPPPELVAALAARRDAVDAADVAALTVTDAALRALLEAGVGGGFAVYEVSDLATATAECAARAEVKRLAAELAAGTGDEQAALAAVYEASDVLAARGELTSVAALDAALTRVWAVDEAVNRMEDAALRGDDAALTAAAAAAATVAAAADSALKGAATIDYVPTVDELRG